MPLKDSYPVTVSDTDMSMGIRKHCTRCMMALAASRATGGQAQVYPDTGSIWIRKGRHIKKYLLPDDIRAKVKAWDEGESVKPFTFEMVA